jgi:hypothetical protein
MCTIAGSSVAGISRPSAASRARTDCSPDNGRINASTVYLTLPELTALTEAIQDLIRPIIEERVIDDVTARPPGSVPVDLSLFAVPGADAPPAPETGHVNETGPDSQE